MKKQLDYYKLTKKERKSAFDNCNEVYCTSCAFEFVMDAEDQKLCQNCLDADSEWENPDSIQW